MLTDLSHQYPPFRMKSSDAAYYSGMSVTAFFRAVEAGEMPKGKKAIGGRYWLRNELEQAMVDVKQPIKHDFGQPI
ncbi:MAG: hypothetical protein ABJL99_10015 [Aliishimia sp.]